MASGGQRRKLALPSSLLNELDAQQSSSRGGNGRHRSQQLSRKEQRKNQRVQKRQSRTHPRTVPRPPTSATGPKTNPVKNPVSSTKSRATVRHESEDDKSGESSQGEGGDGYDGFDDDDDDDDSEMDDDTGSEAEAETPRQPSKSVKNKLAQDDKEISELERKLGLKGRKSLPKSFDEDGLGDLLDGLDDHDEGDGDLSKRKRKAEADEWLAQKRRKAEAAATVAATAKASRFDKSDEGSVSDDWGSEEDGLDELVDGGEGEDEDEDYGDFSDEDEDGDEDGFEGFSENGETDEPARPQRENPYVAPTTNVAKYVPPSLRRQAQSSNEAEAQLRRRVQGLINRLTNDSMIGITKDFLALYDNNPRQIVTNTLVDIVLVLVCSPERRPDSFFTMVAGFVAAIHRAVGMAASAYLLQQMVDVFNKHYEAASGDQSDSASKHLITLLAELYNMQVVGSNLIFDFVRLFLERLSELDTELLLKIIQLCGPSLRREDPHALRDIVNGISAATLQGASVRTGFMIDEMKKLQSNKAKAITRNKDLVEQRSQIKKRIGTLKGSRDEQPLRVGLKDIQGADKEGKWWLVGASWAGRQVDGNNHHGKGSTKAEPDADGNEDEDEFTNDFGDDDDDDLGVPDLWELARQQGFNTEVRQRIFVALHAATDYENAELLIRNLRLNKHQRKEIPEVIVRSGERQQAYNHFYALVAGRFCGLKELAFQFRRSLTVRFARMGEEIDMGGDDAGELYGGGDADDEEDGAEGYDLRRLYNAARMYGSLVAGRSLRLPDLLKYRNLMALQEKAHMFVEVMLLTVLQEAHAGGKGEKTKNKGEGEEAATSGLRGVLEGVDADLGRGVQWFVRKKMRHTDLVKDKKEKKVVRKRCEEVDRILDAMLAEGPVGMIK